MALQENRDLQVARIEVKEARGEIDSGRTLSQFKSGIQL